MKEKNSIIQKNKECWKCKTTLNLHKHHTLYGTANRKKAEEDGCWVWLCARHHNMSDDGVHFNKEFDMELKQLSEQKWLEKNNKEISDFIKRYGKNYLKK